MSVVPKLEYLKKLSVTTTGRDHLVSVLSQYMHLYDSIEIVMGRERVLIISRRDGEELLKLIRTGIDELIDRLNHPLNDEPEEDGS